MRRSKRFIPLIIITIWMMGYGTKNIQAQEDAGNSVSYIPLIGITSVPEPLALPKGKGKVTYRYAVKNFLKEKALSDVHVVDDKCSPVLFTEGDDNGDGLLDYSETWRYSCVTQLSETTQSIATAIGTANALPAAQKAYVTVVVGSGVFPPLVNIINITKVAYPLILPSGGGDITFTYKVNNPGVVPLSAVSVTDDKCSAMSGKLGDTNGNNLLDSTEVWVYTCTTHLSQTTTNTVSVEATANGLKAVGYATLTVTVAVPAAASSPGLPDTGGGLSLQRIVWGILSGILVILLLFFVESWKKTLKKKGVVTFLVVAILVTGVAIPSSYFLSERTFGPSASPTESLNDASDNLFGWKYPVVGLPLTGTNEIAYSDIRDPGGIPQGLPVRLKIPVIGVDSAIEDALITPEGRMDVPSGSRNVAWFALGPHPGQEGSAVIGGHFGIRDGVPFVFYKLDKLTVGDKIYIEDDNGDTLSFVVRSVRLFSRNADGTTVFTSHDGLAHLNLITCEGIWNRVNDSYPERRVVFTDAITANSAAAPTVNRTLRMGASGPDVVTLQTALIQKGLLTIPSRGSKGYFGSLTRTAVANYQRSVGLRASGIFDLPTKTRLIAVRPPATVKPVLPSTALSTPAPTPTTIDAFIQDDLVTSVLVLFIIVTALALGVRHRKKGVR